jgi:hypothetical protein
MGYPSSITVSAFPAAAASNAVLLNPINERRFKDGNFIVTCLLPSGAANTQTNGLDLVQAIPYPVTEKFQVEIGTTASASGNSINMAIAIQHTNANADGTADGGNWVNVATLSAITLVPNATITNATNTIYSMPTVTRRFIRAKAIGATNMGNLADATLTLQILF